MSEQMKVEPLMTEDEIQVLKQISDAEAPHGQRVQALLAVADGKSQEEAADISGLRPNQVKYWVARYQKAGVACFPESLFEAKEAEVEVIEIKEEAKVKETAMEKNITVESLRIEPAEVAVVAEETSPKKKKEKKSKKKKDKKAKSLKESKKAKKEKKGKKDKKDKKAKKESKKPQKDKELKKKKKEKKSKKKKDKKAKSKNK